MRTMSKHSTYSMEIDRWDMNKNSVKADFEKKNRLTGKIKLKMEGNMWIMCRRVYNNWCVMTLRGH